MASIEVQDLWIRYGSKEAVRGVDLTVEAGQIVAVLGRNGAGKTSSIEAIEGYRRVAKGVIRVLGLDPIGDRKKLLPQIGVMLQVGGIYPRMNPLQALELYSGFYESPVPIAELIENTDLKSCQGTPYRFLSGGEKQRLALALALVGQPKVLFLDEPTAGVDPAGKQQIRNSIIEMASKGVAVLLTTHELTEAERICDQIVVIDNGRIVANGSPEQLRQTLGHSTITFRVVGELDRANLSQKLGVDIEVVGEGLYRIGNGAPPSIIGSLSELLNQSGVELLELNAGKSSLEEIFLEITGEADS